MSRVAQSSVRTFRLHPFVGLKLADHMAGYHEGVIVSDEVPLLPWKVHYNVCNAVL
jgi:hypothetical protein